MTWTAPTPEEQVQFLRNIQRLLAEGLFVASYKFALVHALADLAVLKGDDSGAPLEVETKEIAAKFVELYWRQSRPFQTGGETTDLVLQQNTGKQAAIISQIADFSAGMRRLAFSIQANRFRPLVIARIGSRSGCAHDAAVEVADRGRRATRVLVRKPGPGQPDHFEARCRLLLPGLLRTDP